MYDQMEGAEKTADEIARVYKKAAAWLSYEQQAVFEKYMTKHKLSETEALNLLNTLQDKTSIQELLQKLKTGGGSHGKKELLAELEAPAYRARMERLQNIQDQLDKVMREVYQAEKDISTEFYTRLAEEVYYKSVFEMQKRTGLSFNFSHIDSKQIDQVLSMNWSGENYSKRIWKNTDRLAQTLKEELLVNLITGRTEREASEQIALRFGQGAMKARRLVRTESSFVSGELTAAAYEECEIEHYRYLATLDLKTSEMCRELDGQVFPVSERKREKNYPPMHPWCRSTTISIVDKETLSRLTRKAYNPKTGRIERVPATMTYKEWYQKYVAGDKKAEFEERKIKHRSSDQKQHKQYREIFGEKIPERLDDFQDMKYTKPEKWKQFKSQRQQALNEMEFSQMENLKGTLSNRAVRSWYKTKDEGIAEKINTSKSLKEQAVQAFEMRNAYRTQARELMRDRVAREELERNHRNLTFEELMEHKMKKYGLSDEDAYMDIIRSSGTTNKKYDEIAGIRKEEG